MKLLKRASLAVLIIAVAGAALLIPPVGGLGSGYFAKLLCSGVFVSGRAAGDVLAEDLTLDNPLSSLVRTSVDRDAATVTATFIGLVRRTAVHRPGLGCALTVGTSAEDLRAEGSPGGRGTPDTLGVALLDELNPVIADAFVEQDSTALVRTRAVVVLHRGRVVAEAYGPGWDASMPLQGWSMTKTVTGMLIGMRIHDGRLTLDAPAPIEAWQQDERSAITLSHLLRMSSGLAFDELYALPTADAPQSLFNRHAAGVYAARRPLEHEPGTHWAYSSGTTNILQEILRGTFDDDQSYRAYPHQRLFAPIGAGSAVMETDPSGTFVGSSFMYATARDWARLGQLMLQDGMWNAERVLPEGWVNYMTTPAPAARGQYGGQTWLNAAEGGQPGDRSWPTLPEDTFWMSGFDGQFVVVVPSREAVIVRLGLTQQRGAWDQEAFVRAVLQRLPGGA